jgi:hypothetical protein
MKLAVIIWSQYVRIAGTSTNTAAIVDVPNVVRWTIPQAIPRVADLAVDSADLVEVVDLVGASADSAEVSGDSAEGSGDSVSRLEEGSAPSLKKDFSRSSQASSPFKKKSLFKL